jgi:hypothetical protein
MANPEHAKLYSVAEHGSVHVTDASFGVMMAPSASIVEPEGTLQI